MGNTAYWITICGVQRVKGPIIHYWQGGATERQGGGGASKVSDSCKVSKSYYHTTCSQYTIPISLVIHNDIPYTCLST